MKELSLHILDIAQNSVNAGAKNIEIIIDEQPTKNDLIIEIKDNGCGMNDVMLQQLNNPFFTTGNKKTGLGIPLLQQHAEAAGGKVRVQSEEGKGTRVKAHFTYDHIDRQPMGDLIATITGLIRSYPEIDWLYIHHINNKNFKLDTIQVREQLDGLAINHQLVIKFLKDMIAENLKEISDG